MLSDTQLKELLKSIIINLNENLYNWKQLDKELNYTDLLGLFKNWLVRNIKFNTSYLSYRERDIFIEQLYRYGNPKIFITKGNQIQSIEFSFNKDNLINKILQQLDYKSLEYKPMNIIDNKDILKEISDISFKELELIKF